MTVIVAPKRRIMTGEIHRKKIKGALYCTSFEQQQQWRREDRGV